MVFKIRPFRRKKTPKPEPVQPEPLDDGVGGEMSFFEHLDELRQRLFKAAFALVIGTAIGVAVASPVLGYLMEPYCAITEDCRLVSLGPTGGVVAYFRVALLIGGIIAIPTITYQLLMFIFPGLTRKERRTVLRAIPAITGLFLIGVAFSWLVLMPPALGFLEGFQADLIRPEWTADLYLSFVTALIFWMGVAFETPLVFFVLSLIGLVDSGTLMRNWRFAIIGASIAAALITPTIDPVNMFLVMGPLLALYVISIFLVGIGARIHRSE
jgi:sec-independent protein translocase protein TatC